MQHFKVSFIGMYNRQTRGYMHFKTTICATGHSMLNIFNAVFTFHSQSRYGFVCAPRSHLLAVHGLSYPSSCQLGLLLKRSLHDFGFHRHSRAMVALVLIWTRLLWFLNLLSAEKFHRRKVHHWRLCS